MVIKDHSMVQLHMGDRDPIDLESSVANCSCNRSPAKEDVLARPSHHVCLPDNRRVKGPHQAGLPQSLEFIDIKGFFFFSA